MLKISQLCQRKLRRQCGVAAVEFAIIAMLLFTLLFGIVEFGRLLYVFNSVQEVTRRAAREAVVRWTDSDSQADAKALALFCNINLSPKPSCYASPSLPAGAEINPDNIIIDYLNGNRVQLTSLPDSPSENIAECLSGPTGCIAFVRVRIIGATYLPMVGLFSSFAITIPESTVIMPAESMGYSG